MTTEPNTPAVPVPARLALADGLVFDAQAWGATDPDALGGPVVGEVCFNTSMAGYQEVLTDPSYAGQIVVMTATQMGNTGINPRDMESAKAHVKGFVVAELPRLDRHYRQTQGLSDWLAEQGVPLLTGLDTRALTRHLREHGAVDGAIATDGAPSDAELIQAAKDSPGLVGQNLVQAVSRPEPAVWDEDLGVWEPVHGQVQTASDQPLCVVAIDCGMKNNIARHLVDLGCQVTVVPWDTPAAAILERKPDGVFVSNGPGDPEPVQATVATLRELIGKQPIFGICLGHQLLSLALGAETFKLPFGHRGGNHPVQNLGTGKVEITSQNHGFAVTPESLKQAGAQQTHINLNDQTVEGFRHTDQPVFAVQYHPEASPGPHDARYLFDGFRAMMETGQAPTAEAMDQAQRQRLALSSS